MRVLTITGVALALAGACTQPVAADAGALSATANGRGEHSFVYGWTVAKTAARPSVEVPNGGSADVAFTITASRTKVDDGYGVTLGGCAQNGGTSDAADVTLELQLQTAPSPSGPFTDVESGTADYALGTLAAGATVCRNVFFGVEPGAYSRNRVTVSSSGAAVATATSDVISLPAESTSTWDARASVEDALDPCPAGFLCGAPSVAFPLVFPSPARDPGPTAAPFSESITYTERVTAPVCGRLSGTLRNVVTLTELDSGQNLGRSAAAEVALTTVHECPKPATGEATDVLLSSATLNGSVDTHGLAPAAYFEYGQTSTYGMATPQLQLSGDPAVAPVAASLDGLAVGTVYHYRLVTVLGPERAYGADRTFTTRALPPRQAPPSRWIPKKLLRRHRTR